MIAMIDNYDSFTWNLVQYFWELGAEVKVFRNDAISVRQLKALRPSHVVVSPGPCAPNEAGISLDAITGIDAPIFGVCLGHQAIGQAFGGKVVRAKRVMHGKVSRIGHDGKGIFSGLPNRFAATRYHSLVVERRSLPACLDVTADAEDGEIMGVRHRALPIEGVQFHPEALLTEHGHKMLENFLKRNETGKQS
jgi:anthranilate synthase/aminodeoxychorismate synthase-like glutamine amidotransferase